MTTFTAEQVFQIVRAVSRAAEAAAIAPLPEKETDYWDQFCTDEDERRLMISAAAHQAMFAEIASLGITLPQYFADC